MVELIEYEQANPEVRAVYDDMRATRKTDYINNIWKALAHHPETLRRTWEEVKALMSIPSSLDPLTKELIYIAVSVTNNCEYCVATHTASAKAKGMTEQQFGELMAIIALANKTNRLAIGYRVEVDERYKWLSG
ncbi:MAG: carboxymuconolactone decarboxylase family protein [Anaerolineae bacterium]|nr:carboxymuconolactone decarboxylase family protein [Anaerolineae bacterium]